MPRKTICQSRVLTSHLENTMSILSANWEIVPMRFQVSFTLSKYFIILIEYLKCVPELKKTVNLYGLDSFALKWWKKTVKSECFVFAISWCFLNYAVHI